MSTEILNHLWQSTAFAAVCALLTLLLRQNRAQIRYAMWLAASLKFLLPFSALIFMGRALGPWILPATNGHGGAPPTEFIAAPVMRTVMVRTMEVPGSLIGGTETGSSMLFVLLGGVWALGSAVLFGKWIFELVRLSRELKRGGAATDGREVAILRRLEARGGAARPLVIVMSDTRIEPGIFGMLEPRLLWPRRISAHLDDAQVEAILAHELSHVGRYDNLLAAIQLAVQALFWFHPLVWWIGARLVDERERACDEDVLRQGSEPEVYAESILRTCRFAIESPLMCVAGVTGADLKRRIETIMSERPVHPLGFGKRVVLAAAAASAMTVPFVVGMLHAPRMHAQSEGLRIGERKFEVASVKPNQSAQSNGTLRRLPGGRVTATNMPLRQLIAFAYQLTPFTLVNAPSWIDTARFDIEAKIEGGEPPALPPGTGPDDMMLAMRSLLAERFHLEVHQETRQLDVYALVPARASGNLGPSLKPSTEDCSPEAMRALMARGASGAPLPAITDLPQCGMRMMPGRLMMGGLPLAMFVRPLGGAVGRIVVDRTKLSGNWDIDVKFAPEPGRGSPPPGAPAPDPDAPSIFTAVQEQLGLKLESTKAPIDVLAVDHVEAPSPD